VHSVHNVAFWFTRKDDSFEGFVGNLFEIRTWDNPSNQQMVKFPSLMDHTRKGQPLEKVSTIKTFFQFCVKLLNDPSSIKVLQNLLE
jgi:hypothetical protein